MPKSPESPSPAPSVPAPASIVFPTGDSVVRAAIYMLTPAKERNGSAREKQTALRAARSVLAFAFVAYDSRQPAEWVSWSVTMDNGSTQPLHRIVSVLAIGDDKSLGRIVGRA